MLGASKARDKATVELREGKGAARSKDSHRKAENLFESTTETDGISFNGDRHRVVLFGNVAPGRLEGKRGRITRTAVFDPTERTIERTTWLPASCIGEVTQMSVDEAPSINADVRKHLRRCVRWGGGWSGGQMVRMGPVERPLQKA